MRNLRNAHRSVLRSPDGLSLTAAGWDVGADHSIVCAFGPTPKDPLVQLKRRKNTYQSHDSPSWEHVASWDALCPLPDLECDKILNLHVLDESRSICLVFAGGDIVVVRENPSEVEDKIEIVGSVDVGITAAAWAPDEELLAITTRGDTMLFMTKEFENVLNATLSEEDLKASKHVSVGWGKKETQFKGRGAKALRDPTMPEKVDEGIPSPFDEDRSSISWRGDGAYVAINSTQASSRRVIRAYSREGQLDGVSEPVDRLEGALSWRPAGNIIAGVQRFDDRIDIVFFERNGLRHGQFSLRVQKSEMDTWASSIALEWNVDSSVLAVCFLDRVQLWTMGNYHYYLKQEIPFQFDLQPQNPIRLNWHPERALDFIADGQDGCSRFEFVSYVAAGSVVPPNDYGIVAVIDGRYLNLTPFRLANIPPPMALRTIEAASNIVHAAISAKGSDTRIVILEGKRLSIYKWNLKSKPAENPALMDSKDVLTLLADELAQQAVLLTQTRVLILSSGISGSTVHAFEIAASELKHVACYDRPYITGLITSPKGLTSVPYYKDLGGGVTADIGIYDSKPNCTSLTGFGDRNPSLRTPEVCVVDNGDVELDYQKRSVPSQNHFLYTSTNDYGRTVIFSLGPTGLLYANSRRLAKDCTSFVIAPAHLIFTTSQHLLKLVHLTIAEELEVPPDTPEADERCRNIERGAKLITVVPSTSAVILQMPRGNLETIYPRGLVLAGIRQNVDAKRYREAFLTCRSHRVDMNILHDHAPEIFLSDVGMFCDQVEKVEYLDLFLSQLREEDVSKTMYRDTAESKIQNLNVKNVMDGLTKATGLSKVNKICDKFLEVLQPRMSTNLQNVITAHLCKVPPDLDAGLLEVGNLRREDSGSAEKAVEHICFLADVNRLYESALGLYDLDLALLIAQQSQKDPREYLPFLQKLQELPPVRKRFTIDDFLGRRSKALTHLSNMPQLDEFLQYMVKHNLYEEALNLRRYDEEMIRRIMHRYAGYLSQEAKYKEAAIAFEYLQDYALASKAYRQAHLWKESLSSASLASLALEEMKSLINQIEDSLLEAKDYHSAAIINLDYKNDIESTARLFCKGYFFSDAIRVLSLNKRSDLISTVVDDGLAEGFGTMTVLLAECKNQINAQVPRIRELRIKKKEEPSFFYDADVNDGADIPDNVSLAPTDASTTGGTLFTRYTDRTGTIGTNVSRKTSKHKKREERKRARGKKGTVYEEEYLVNSIGRLVERVNSVGEEMERLMTGLIRRGMRERAMALQEGMIEVVELCKACVEEVFSKKTGSVQNKDGPAVDEANRPSGGDGVLWDSLETSQWKEAPLVKDFRALSLLPRR